MVDCLRYTVIRIEDADCVERRPLMIIYAGSKGVTSGGEYGSDRRVLADKSPIYCEGSQT